MQEKDIGDFYKSLEVKRGPFSEGGNFSQLFYPILARFDSSAYPFLDTMYLVSDLSMGSSLLKGHFCQEENKFQMECLHCLTFSPEQIGADRSNHVSHQQNPKLFKCPILQLFELVEDYLYLKNLNENGLSVTLDLSQS